MRFLCFISLFLFFLTSSPVWSDTEKLQQSNWMTCHNLIESKVEGKKTERCVEINLGYAKTII